jgi:hypothetical protein
MPLSIEIVTPEQRVLTTQCDEVRLPGAEGGFGIRPGHTPLVAALAAGELVYRTTGVVELGPGHGHGCGVLGDALRRGLQRGGQVCQVRGELGPACACRRELLGARPGRLGHGPGGHRLLEQAGERGCRRRAVELAQECWCAGCPASVGHGQPAPALACTAEITGQRHRPAVRVQAVTQAGELVGATRVGDELASCVLGPALEIGETAAVREGGVVPGE